MPRVVLGVSGGIGAYKACEILRGLQKRGVDVQVAMTTNAARFVTPLTFEALTRSPVFIDQFATGEGGDIRHIELADQAELLVVAPATANILAKFAAGIADDALTTLFLATRAPVLVAPTMNVNMFQHPSVVANLDLLKKRGVKVIEPGSGYLACGWLGKGRLAEVEEIVEACMAALTRRTGLEGERVLVTAGPTNEDLDPVRYLSNRSSGRMGFRLAESARDRGAAVTLVSGPVALEAPQGMEVLPVWSAQEMARVVHERAKTATIVVMAAAVSDYRPVERAPTKIKKGEDVLTLSLVRNPDILAELGKASPRPFLVGFAAETDRLLENAREKRERKKVDLIVGNPVGSAESGFGSDRNSAILIDEKGETTVPETTKRELAEAIWDRVIALKAPR